MTQQEIVVLPPSTADVAALPLIADIQFLELFTSESLNRKFYGIVRPGIFRGFNYEIGDGLALTVGDDTKQNTAFVERDGYTLTVQGQHPVTVTIPAGQKSAVVIEAFYQYGVKTKQVDANSDIDAASIKVVPSTAVEPHHVIVCEVTVPPEASQLTMPMISIENRREGGVDMSSHIEHDDPHVQYAFRQALTDEIARAMDAETEIDTRLTDAIADAVEQLNAEVRRAKQEESRIDGKLNAEISRSTAKDNELTQKLNELMAIMATGKHDRGPWDASGGQFPPTPNNTVDHYRISASGTMKNSTQTIQANTGDNLYWELATKRWYLIDNTDQVTSVDGQKGAITLPKSSAIDSTSETTIANVHGVKKAFDKGVEALERANNTYPKAESDNRFLGKAESAADSAKLGGVEAGYNVENKTGNVVFKPKGGEYRTLTSGVTGAFKVKLPHFKSQTMLGMHFRLFDYNSNESCDLYIHGYSYTEGWVNCSAYMIGNNKELPVRFCMSESESYLCIGDSTQSWTHPALTLLSVTTSYRNTEAHKWNSGWAISLVTDIPEADIKQTIVVGIPYTTRKKPTPKDIGSYSKGEVDTLLNALSGVPKFKVVNQNYVMGKNEGVAVNVSGGPRTITLPDNPSIGDTAWIKDYDGSCSVTKHISVIAAQKIHGGTKPLKLESPGISAVFSYIDANVGWQIVAGKDIDNGAGVPIGTICMFAHKAVPAGFIDLCVPNPTFDILEYPGLAKLYPDGVLPSYLDRYAKGVALSTVGSTGSWMIPQHTHSTDIGHGHAATQVAHSHTKGSMNITGETAIGEFDATRQKGAFNGKHSYSNAGNGTSAGGGTDYYTKFDASRSWTGETSSVAPSITVANFSGSKISSGIREAINKGNRLDVDHVGVTFAIKAAGKASEEGLMEVTAIRNDVNELKQRVDNIHNSIRVWITFGDEHPKDFFGGEWVLIDADASLAFGDGTVQSGVAEGDNNPVVPLPAHTHTGKAASAGAHTHNMDFNHAVGNGGAKPVGFHNVSTAFTKATSSAGAHEHSLTINSAGTSGARLNVRGARVKVNVWRRVK